MSEDYMMDSATAAAAGGISAGVMIFYIAILVLLIVAMWKIYTKAGKPGWASIIPFYSQYVMFDIAMGNGWLFLLMLIPIVNWVMSIVVLYKLAKAFGKGVGYTVGLILLCPIFLCMLAFGSAEYEGPQ